MRYCGTEPGHYLADNVINTSHRGPHYRGRGAQTTPRSVCNKIRSHFRKIKGLTGPVCSRVRLTLYIQQQRVALPVSHHVGGHAGVEAGVVGVDGLDDEGLVTEDNAVGNILINPLSLEKQRR